MELSTNVLRRDPAGIITVLDKFEISTQYHRRLPMSPSPQTTLKLQGGENVKAETLNDSLNQASTGEM